jgi:hypothetical protein
MTEQHDNQRQYKDKYFQQTKKKLMSGDQILVDWDLISIELFYH